METVEVTEDLVVLQAPEGTSGFGGEFDGEPLQFTAEKDGTFRLPRKVAEIMVRRHGWQPPEPVAMSAAAFTALTKQRTELESRRDGLRQQVGTIGDQESALLAKLEVLRADIKAGKIEAVAAIAPAEAELAGVRSTLAAVRDAEVAVGAEFDLAAEAVAAEQHQRESIRQRKASAGLRAEAEKCLAEFQEAVLSPRRALRKLRLIAGQMEREFPLATAVPTVPFSRLVELTFAALDAEHAAIDRRHGGRFGADAVGVWLRQVLSGPGAVVSMEELERTQHVNRS